MILGPGKKYCPTKKIISSYGKDLEVRSGRSVYENCKNYLCPKETRIRECHPTLLHARLRAKALDPFGFMVLENLGKNAKDKIQYVSKCQHENCHAILYIRQVLLDSECNSFAIFGCCAHQHPLVRHRKSEIVFENKLSAVEFYKQYIQTGMYIPRENKNRGDWFYEKYECRRKKLNRKNVSESYLEQNGSDPNCKSWVSITQTFRNDGKEDCLDSSGINPHSVKGIFYHTHEYDEKYHFDRRYKENPKIKK